VDKNYFEILNSVDVSTKIEKKNNLSYLSWAWAWQGLKKLYPTANYKVYENAQEWNYFTDGHTGWVKTGVTVDGLEHIEYLPIMDFKNKSIALDAITSFDVNKAIQRSLTKAVARHGLGLYIYAGEDLPEGEECKIIEVKEVQPEAKKWTKPTKQQELHQLALEKKNPNIIWSEVLKCYNVSKISDLSDEQVDEIKGDYKL